MSTAADPYVQTITRPQIEITEPPLFRVIYINDNTTAMEFVIESLMEHFHYTAEAAEQMTITIHEVGSAIVAVLPYEIAEQKGIEITVSARTAGYPLQIKLEPDQ